MVFSGETWTRFFDLLPRQATPSIHNEWVYHRLSALSSATSLSAQSGLTIWAQPGGRGMAEKCVGWAMAPWSSLFWHQSSNQQVCCLITSCYCTRIICTQKCYKVVESSDLEVRKTRVMGCLERNIKIPYASIKNWTTAEYVIGEWGHTH